MYKDNGSIGISKEVKTPQRQIELSETIDALALEHERLRIIRQVWYHIANSHLYGIADVKSAIHHATLRNTIYWQIAVCLYVLKKG